MIDLHVHSFVSDGEYSPEELVDRAKAKGLSAISVSDHDTLEGSRRALIRGREIGFNVVPGVEISTALNGKVLHLLGHYIDMANDPLLSRLAQAEAERVERAVLVAQRINEDLRAEGKELLDPEHIRELGKVKSVTGADVAQYALDLGNVSSRTEAFERWINHMRLPVTHVDIKEAIGLVHMAHGVATLAHPNSKNRSIRAITEDANEHKKILASLKEAGLDAVEVYRLNLSKEEQGSYKDMAVSLGLIPSGGSDYHGPSNLSDAQEIGAVDTPDEVLDLILQARPS